MSEVTLEVQKSKLKLIGHDIVLISIMAVLAACGLIYEYLLSHFAGRILGSMETTIYAMIGLMIVAMGLGSLSAKYLRNPFSAFAWLEVLVALFGMSSILIVSAILAAVHMLPQVILDVYDMPLGIEASGAFERLKNLSYYSPYVIGFVLGFFIGMEIPLIARVRQSIYGAYLENNAGTIYGADYIGAGCGAVVWILLMLSIDIVDAAILTALFNVIAGLIFVAVYYRSIKWRKALVATHFAVLVLMAMMYFSGKSWMKDLSNVLYQDRVVLSYQTQYQHLTVTERFRSSTGAAINDFFINGRLQFSTMDEHIYHSMLVYPAMLGAAKRDNVLVIGGGDGLALRNVLRWGVKQATLIDIDQKLVGLFSGQDEEYPELSKRFADINQNSLNDPRVTKIYGDAFIEIDLLDQSDQLFDVIIIDLPDPHHPDLNKLYSTYFYQRLSRLLSGGGILVAQSTSPFHAREAFLSIGKSMAAASFAHVEQYRQNVPSFGEWGWTIATKLGQSPRSRISRIRDMPVDDEWVTRELILASFQFPKDFFNNIKDIRENTLGSGVVYQYHDKAWRRDEGEVYSR